MIFLSLNLVPTVNSEVVLKQESQYSSPGCTFRASRHLQRTLSIILAGWPTRTIGMISLLWISFSAMLSTAVFEGAQHKIFERGYNLACCSINSTMVVVLPVPGGPWINASSLDFRQCKIVSFWTLFKFLLNHEFFTRFSISFEILSKTVDGVSMLHKMSHSFCCHSLAELKIRFVLTYLNLRLKIASLHLWKDTRLGILQRAMLIESIFTIKRVNCLNLWKIGR